MNNEQKLQHLRNAIEQALGHSMDTPRDFKLLSESLRRRLGEQLSVSTLKRLWGYVNNDFNPSAYTLNTLARFLGYDGWEHFSSSTQGDKSPSHPIMARRINATELQAGDMLELTWAPGRQCLVRYLGGIGFEVEQSQATQLQPGDTFECALFIEGEALYLDNLHRHEKNLGVYVCGQVSGIRFELLKDSTPPQP